MALQHTRAPQRLSPHKSIGILMQRIGVWLAILKKRFSKLDCILAMGESTIALGWIQHLTFVGRVRKEIIMTAGEQRNREWLDS